MTKKRIFLLIGFICIIICIILSGVFILLYTKDDREIELERIGVGSSFKYDSNEIIKDIYAFTGKKTILKKYYYSEDKEELLIKKIDKYEYWRKIEEMDNVDFYFSSGIEPVSSGYIFFENYDYHHKVYDEHDYYNNLKLGGTVTQYYLIGVIDTYNNVIWYYETERIMYVDFERIFNKKIYSR